MHIYDLELLTKSKAATVIFSQSTVGEASDEEVMSCDNEVSVTPPPMPKSSNSSQTLWGATFQKALALQTSASLGWPTVLEKLFGKVPFQCSWTAVPMPCTQTHSTESQESWGSTGSKQKVHPSGESNVKPPEKQLHHSSSDNTVFIMMDSTAAAALGCTAKEPPTLSLEKVAPSSHQGWATHSATEHSHGSGSASSQVCDISEESTLDPSHSSFLGGLPHCVNCL